METKEINKEFLRSRVTSYVNISGLRGFVYLQSSKSTFEQIRWTIACIATIAVTFYDVGSSIQTFSQNPTMTKLVMHSDLPVSLA